MKYLSGLDNLFLNQETPTQHMHVGGLGIYNPSSAPGGRVRFKTVLDFFLQRMADAPVFRRRLVHTPLDLDRPYWVSDPQVDVEYHVRHLGLPKPGDWRQLMIQIARIHSRPLDLSKPPWEAYIIDALDHIDGLPKGSFALYIKFHHAAIDGESAAHLIGSLHTLQADFTQDSPRRQRTIIADREPTALELLSRALVNRSRQALDLAAVGATVGQYALQTAGEKMPSLFGDDNDSAAPPPGQSERPKSKRPDTRFNAPISAHRVLDAVGFSLQDCQTIRANVPGSTINDIFLTVTGGAIKRYLVDKGEPPDSSLMGTMPMTLRSSDKGGDEGNQIAQVYYSLRTDIDDPVARLRAVNAETSGLKTRVDSGLGKDIQKRLLDVLPAQIIAKPLTEALAKNANVNVSNVRGPDVPLFLAGAKLDRFIPFSLVMEGCGLNITGFSYNGVMWVAVTCCRDMLPDPAHFSQCLNASFDDLKQAAQSQAEGGKPAKRAPRRGGTARRKANTTAKASTTRRKKSTTRKKTVA